MGLKLSQVSSSILQTVTSKHSHKKSLNICGISRENRIEGNVPRNILNHRRFNFLNLTFFKSKMFEF